MSETVTRTDRLKAAHEKLHEAVESIVTGEDWQRMLKTAAKFHGYSFSNMLLIFSQKPDATLVAGFRRWLELGRHVRKGEKGIAIFAPCKYKVSPSSDGPAAASSDGKNKIEGTFSSAVKVAAPGGRLTADGFQIRGFRVVYVFDISQTEGDDIPDLDAVRPKLLDGDAPEGIWDALVRQATAAGFQVVRDRKRSENGYCDLLNKEIAVRPDVAPAQAVKTLVHELAHALLHANEVSIDRSRQEVEVESVAFVVLDALGLSSDDYSLPYAARWSDGDVDKIKETGERVVSCAASILRRLEAREEVSNIFVR